MIVMDTHALIWLANGAGESAVFEELRVIVEETIDLYVSNGKPLPPATSGRDYANKMQHVA